MAQHMLLLATLVAAAAATGTITLLPTAAPVVVKAIVVKPVVVKAIVVKPVVVKPVVVKAVVGKPLFIKGVPIVQKPVVVVHPTPPPISFYVVGQEPVPLKVEPCATLTCDLNDQEASYIVYQVLIRSHGLQTLLNARTVRVLFNFDIKFRLAAKVAVAKSRLAVLNLEIALLSGLHSPLLARNLRLAELQFVSVTAERNVQQCVQLSHAAVVDMWAGYVYEVVDLGRVGGDLLTDFLVNVVLFLGAMDVPTSHPSAYDFVVFLEKRFLAIKANQCTKVTPVQVSPIAVLPKMRLVVKLVTISNDGKKHVVRVPIPKPTIPAPAVVVVPYKGKGKGKGKGKTG